MKQINRPKVLERELAKPDANGRVVGYARPKQGPYRGGERVPPVTTARPEGR